MNSCLTATTKTLKTKVFFIVGLLFWILLNCIELSIFIGHTVRHLECTPSILTYKSPVSIFTFFSTGFFEAFLNIFTQFYTTYNAVMLKTGLTSCEIHNKTLKKLSGMMCVLLQQKYRAWFFGLSNIITCTFSSDLTKCF